MSEKDERLYERETEEQVLGMMLVESTAVPKVTEVLGLAPDPFFTVQHRIIYDAVLTAYDRNAGLVDPMKVAAELKDADQLKRAGGVVYLHDLFARIVETGSVEFHAKRLRDLHMRRQLAKAGLDISNSAYELERETVDVFNAAQENLQEIARARPRGILSVEALVNDVVKDVEEAHHNRGDLVGQPVGFTELDLMTGGLHRGELVVVAARPSMGKTALGLNMATNMALDHDKTVAFFSLEMPAKELTLRLLSSESKIPLKELRAGSFPEDKWQDLCDHAANLHNHGKNILFNDIYAIDPRVFKLTARRLKHDNPALSCIFIDYLQKMSPGSARRENREQQIAEITRELKGLAMELEIPVVAMSQLNRELERRPDKRPMLADLRESGAIEQDADVVMFLHREEYFDEHTERPGQADIIVSKQRNGPTGDVTLRFEPEYMRFSNLEV